MTSTGPVLFCYDGSEGSHRAMAAAADLVAHPGAAVVLVVWTPAYARMALAGAFAPLVLEDEPKLDGDEESAAAAAAEEGVARAEAVGFDASTLVRKADEGVAHTIIAVAEEIDARLVVCGQRGRGALRSALLGSVSHQLASHARRPVLISPER